MLEPLPTPVCYALHPVNELKEICKARHMLLDMRTVFESKSGNYETGVFIDEEIFATFRHEEKSKSRKFAAFKVSRKSCECLWEFTPCKFSDFKAHIYRRNLLTLALFVLCMPGASRSQGKGQAITS